MEEAIAAPRLHPQWSPRATEFEPLFDPDESGFVQRRIDTSTEKVGQLPGRGIEEGGCLEHGPCG